jgi:TatD DNase family protein
MLPDVMELIDSHCHFDEERFDADRCTVYQRARDAGVAAQVLPGVDAQGWPKLKRVAANYPGLYAAYGLHPIALANHRLEHLDELEAWIAQEQPVAIGECGLDFYIKDLDTDQQVYFFTAQLRMARAYDIPVIIHARRAVDQVLKYVRRFAGVRGVVHSFSGSEQQARRLLDSGMLLGFGGPLSYPRATRLHHLVKVLPLSSFVLETDAPFQPGIEHQGHRNEPGFLTETLATIAHLRDQDPTEIATVTTRNACELFGITPCPTPSPAPRF